MSTRAVLEQARALSDEDIVGRVIAGETALFELIMRRYNQRMYRLARSILRDDVEAEDVMQDAYVRAYEHLVQFEGRAKFSTWLTRILIHEALARRQRRNRMDSLDDDANFKREVTLMSQLESPEQTAGNAELTEVLERAILDLPSTYREVLMMRDIEEMSTFETAEALDITEENVKVRLHRARALLRKELFARVGATSKAAFPFMGARCDAVVTAVLERILA